MQNIRYITLTKSDISALADLMLQIEATISQEREEYTEVSKLFDETKTSFIYFAEESYESAKESQQRAKDKAFLVEAAVDKLNDYSFTFNRLRNEVDNLIAILKTLKMYGHFLYTVSPMPWRELRKNKFARSISVSMKMFSSDMCLPSADEGYQIIIPFLINDSPELYFKKPKEIIAIFDEMSKQCLNYMEMDVFTSNILRNIFDRRDYLKSLLEFETNEIQDIITMNEKEILWLELKEIEYKNKFKRILVNEFKSLFASYEVSKLFTCLQYVHTQIFATPEDPKDCISSLTVNLETLYLDLTSKLDSLDQDIVKIAKQEMFSEDIRIMKQAKLAQRTMKECDILKKCLCASFEPPRHRSLRHK